MQRNNCQTMPRGRGRGKGKGRGKGRGRGASSSRGRGASSTAAAAAEAEAEAEAKAEAEAEELQNRPAPDNGRDKMTKQGKAAIQEMFEHTHSQDLEHPAVEQKLRHVAKSSHTSFNRVKGYWKGVRNKKQSMIENRSPGAQLPVRLTAGCTGD